MHSGLPWSCFYIHPHVLQQFRFRFNSIPFPAFALEFNPVPRFRKGGLCHLLDFLDTSASILKAGTGHLTPLAGLTYEKTS